MVGKHRAACAHTRQHTFSPARKTGKEMRFDKTFAHQQVRFGSPAVYPQRSAGGQCAQHYHVGVISAVMHLDTLCAHKFPAKLFLQFGLRCAAMAAGGDEDRDICIRAALADGVQHRRNDHFAGNGPGVVAGKKHNGLFTAAQNLKPGALNRRLHGLTNQFLHRG